MKPITLKKPDGVAFFGRVSTVNRESKEWRSQIGVRKIAHLDTTQHMPYCAPEARAGDIVRRRIVRSAGGDLTSSVWAWGEEWSEERGYHACKTDVSYICHDLPVCDHYYAVS